MLRPPLVPMLATSVDRLPAADSCRGGCRYEPKWDGWRALVFRSAEGVYLQSRSGKALTRYFPEVVRQAREVLPPGAVLDGELIVWDTARGRTSFTALQSRLSAGGPTSGDMAAKDMSVGDVAVGDVAVVRQPAHFVAFDLLQAPRGVELLGLPLSERRRQLERLLAGSPASFELCPQTDAFEQAREWLASWPAAGVEGLMVKGATTPYRPGERGWAKLRHRSTTEAVVGGITGSVEAPETLLLGRFDEVGELRFVGRTGAVRPNQRAALAAALRPAADSPWPQPMPVGWQFGGDTSVAYAPVEPALVVEIEVDPTFEHGRWRHPPRLVRIRTDLDPAQVPRWSPDWFVPV